MESAAGFENHTQDSESGPVEKRVGVRRRKCKKKTSIGKVFLKSI